MNRAVGGGFLVAGVCFLGSWTLYCYLMVFSALSFSDLRAWSFMPVAAALGIWALYVNQGALVDNNRTDGSIQPGLSSGPGSAALWALLVLIISAFTLRILDGVYWAVWLALLGVSTAVFRIVSTSAAPYDEPLVVRPNQQRIGIVAAVLFGVVLVAITHRVDRDDAQYLNFVVTALDFPFEPMLSHSGLWKDPDVPLESPIYRFHTYELLVATLSDVFSLDHKVIYYLILAPFFGGIAVVVHWELARYLVPRYAFSVLVAWLVLMIALGDSHREFGNFAFVRLYQGKGLLVTVGLPLCFLLGLRFAEVPDGRRALALGMGILASLGLTSSALPTVPFVVAATLWGGLLGSSRREAMRLMATGLLSGFLLCAVGLFLMASTKGLSWYSGVTWSGSGRGLSIVLGDGTLAAIILVLFPIAPLFVRGYRRRRLYALTALVFVGLVLNPWLGEFLSKNVDKALAWRLLWAVPFVISASIALVGLAALLAEQVPRLKYHVVVLMMLVAVLALSGQWSVSSSNQVAIAFPRFKVEPDAHQLAEEIVRRAPRRSTIYAPAGIAEWISTFRMHPYPLIVRPLYLKFKPVRKHVGRVEIDRRERVVDFLQGDDKERAAVEFFQSQLLRDRPAFVVYDSGVEMAPVISGVLGAAGYVGEKRDIYRLWHLPRSQ